MDPRTSTSLVNERFGELVVIGRAGSKVYRCKNRLRNSTSVWTLGCSHGHTETRTRISLRITGQNTKCKTCHFYRFGRHRKDTSCDGSH